MYDKPAHHRSDSEYHDRNRRPLKRPSSSDEPHEDGAARLATRAFKHLRIDNTRSSSRSSSMSTRNSDLSKEQHPHRRSSSSSRTRPHSPRPSRLSGSHHDTQQRKDSGIVENVVERLRMHTAKRFNDIKERLRDWEENGFVNPGCSPPPIADPTLYFIFDDVRLLAQKDDIRQKGEFTGHRIYEQCLVQALKRRRLPRRCISTLLNAFQSKTYQARLFRAWNNLESLIPGKIFSEKSYADAIELYCALGSRDPLYEFSQTSFQTLLTAALHHALLPLLNYMEEIYEFPPDIYNIVMSDYKYFSDKFFEFTLESEPILQSILHANYDKNKNHKSNYSGHLWKSVIDFSVPKDEHHEFWLRLGLSPGDDNFRNSVPLQVPSFGASREEAKMFASIKLKNLIELIRTILRNIKETNDIDLLISELLREPIIPSFPGMNCPVIDIGARLFKFYGCHQKEENNMHSIATFIKELSETCSIELQPLLKYYLTYPLIRQEKLIEAAESLPSLEICPRLTPFILTRLEELRQLFWLYDQDIPESLEIEDVFGFSII